MRAAKRRPRPTCPWCRHGFSLSEEDTEAILEVVEQGESAWHEPMSPEAFMASEAAFAASRSRKKDRRAIRDRAREMAAARRQARPAPANRTA